MAEIINLRRARKQRDAAAREAQAQQNRTLFGRTAGQRARDEQEQDRATRRAEQARLDGREPEKP